MKLLALIFTSLLIYFTFGCRTTKSVAWSTMSTDSLYISQNTSWKAPDSNVQSLLPDKKFMVAEVELIKIDKNSFIRVSAYARKTLDDSVTLFWPEEGGANFRMGTLNSGFQIKSKDSSINGKKIDWANNSIKFESISFVPLHKTNLNSFKEIITKYSCYKGNDFYTITFVGP